MAAAVITDVTDHSRPFTFGDAMILIVALALGMAITRPGIVLIAEGERTIPLEQFQRWPGPSRSDGFSTSFCSPTYSSCCRPS